MNFNLKYLILPMSIFICINNNYVNAMESAHSNKITENNNKLNQNKNVNNMQNNNKIQDTIFLQLCTSTNNDISTIKALLKDPVGSIIPYSTVLYRIKNLIYSFKELDKNHPVITTQQLREIIIITNTISNLVRNEDPYNVEFGNYQELLCKNKQLLESILNIDYNTFSNFIDVLKLCNNKKLPIETNKNEYQYSLLPGSYKFLLQTIIKCFYNYCKLLRISSDDVGFKQKLPENVLKNVEYVVYHLIEYSVEKINKCYFNQIIATCEDILINHYGTTNFTDIEQEFYKLLGQRDYITKGKPWLYSSRYGFVICDNVFLEREISERAWKLYFKNIFEKVKKKININTNFSTKVLKEVNARKEKIINNKELGRIISNFLSSSDLNNLARYSSNNIKDNIMDEYLRENLTKDGKNDSTMLNKKRNRE